jgi:hypothetical protein
MESVNNGLQKAALYSSNIGQTLISLSGKSHFDHVSGRTLRHGYMAAIVKLANILIKNKTTNEVVSGYLESLGEGWGSFTEGEVRISNDKDTRSLGG